MDCKVKKKLFYLSGIWTPEPWVLIASLREQVVCSLGYFSWFFSFQHSNWNFDCCLNCYIPRSLVHHGASVIKILELSGLKSCQGRRPYVVHISLLQQGVLGKTWFFPALKLTLHSDMPVANSLIFPLYNQCYSNFLFNDGNHDDSLMFDVYVRFWICHNE